MQHHSYGPTNKTMTVEKQHKLRISSHREIDTTEALKSLRRGHIALYDTMEHINAIYQIHLLASITTSVIKILFNSYNILFVFASSKIDGGSIEAGKVVSYLWCIYYCFRFMFLVTFAHCTVSAGRQTRNIIAKVDSREYEHWTREEVGQAAEKRQGVSQETQK